MKAKMIVKCNTLMSIESRKEITDYIINAWNNPGIIVADKLVDIETIIYEDRKGEIKVINLKESNVKAKKSIFNKIIKLKLFKKKKKEESE